MNRYRLAFALAVCALSCAASVSAFELSDYKKDQGSPTKILKLKTAAKKTIKVRDNAFQKSSLNPFSKDRWNPWSKRNRTLKNYRKATQEGGYANINMPFQTNSLSPKIQNKDAKPAKLAKVKSQKHWHWL